MLFFFNRELTSCYTHHIFISKLFDEWDNSGSVGLKVPIGASYLHRCYGILHRSFITLSMHVLRDDKGKAERAVDWKNEYGGSYSTA